MSSDHTEDSSLPTALHENATNEDIDALVKIVKTQSLVDDVIDGVYMGLLTISLLFILFVTAIGPQLGDLFPILQPVFLLFSHIVPFFKNIPSYVSSAPECFTTLISNLPTTLVEYQSLYYSFAQAFRTYLTILPYKQLILLFSWGAYLWDAYLDVRQRDMLHGVIRPSPIRSIVTRKAFLEANSYGLDKSSLKMVQSLLEQIKTTLVLYYDILPAFWNLVGEFMQSRLGFGPEHEITHSILFFIATSLVNSITSIPFDLYGTFVVEQKHGFNKQTVGLYIADFFKTLALTASFGSLILAGLLYTITKTGENFYLYVMIFMMVIQLIGITIFPTLIQPLFNKFTPLEDGELKTSIENLAARLEFPLKKLYVVDGSKRSGHSNAYMYGFFKNKRIVLYDTLLKQTSIEEVCAILAHELGHWKMNHVIKMLFISQIQIFVIFYLFSLVIVQKKLYTDFGFTSMPIFVGFMLYQYLYQPVDSVVTYYFNKLSRKHEFEADAFSNSLGYHEQLKQGLIKIHLENKGNLNPDSLYSAYHYSHPPLVERLNALDRPATPYHSKSD
ncbi:CAAX prenyl protease 1-like protein [Smittium mucronatum]|uniref:CAAX prenyl protease 1 homolog n=1 Tax=Smittium mucronatum TaxID=133383 RepID=A0A1R0GVV7_9FUNG|nr:CAAX prenyl protease 1-like protein [Smittium mucronatum]